MQDGHPAVVTSIAPALISILQSLVSLTLALHETICQFHPNTDKLRNLTSISCPLKFPGEEISGQLEVNYTMCCLVFCYSKNIKKKKKKITFIIKTSSSFLCISGLSDSVFSQEKEQHMDGSPHSFFELLQDIEMPSCNMSSGELSKLLSCPSTSISNVSVSSEFPACYHDKHTSIHLFIFLLI